MSDQANKLRELFNDNSTYDTQTANTRIVAITSGKGGVGKSALTVNLAIALSRLGKRVLIFDADFGLANIDVMIGVTTKYDLLHVINKEMGIRDIILKGHEGVYFISGGSGVTELINLNETQLEGLITELKKLDDIADIILFDTGAGVSDIILRLIYASTETIVITTPEPTAIVDAYAMVKSINHYNMPPTIKIVVNRAESIKEALGIQASFINIAKKYMNMDIEPLGYILNDPMMTKAIKRQIPLMIGYPGSVAAKDVESIARRYLEVPADASAKGGIAGFFSRVFGSR